MSNIKLSNNSKGPLTIALEPEGSTFKIPVGDFVEISLDAESLPIELVYDYSDGENILSIWPNLGFPNVSYKGNNLLG